MMTDNNTKLSATQSLVKNLAQQLMGELPFSAMQVQDVNYFIESSQEAYFAPDEVILTPENGVPKCLYLLRQGTVLGKRVVSKNQTIDFEVEAGQLFSVGAILTKRAVSSIYSARGDCFCLLLSADAMDELNIKSPPFLDFIKNHFKTILEKSQDDMRMSFASQAYASQLHHSTLGSLPLRPPITVLPNHPIKEALEMMDEKEIGSILVADEQQQPLGILTRHDILKRIVLSQIDLSKPIAEVMSKPIQSLEFDHSIEEASHLMLDKKIRHLPVLKQGKVIGLVSERDLFSLQRFSTGNISSAIRAATEIKTLAQCAKNIRSYAENLLGQGVSGQRLTSMISYLNDLLTEHVIMLTMQKHQVDSQKFIWFAMGSEGRGEQTISTDQDNGMVLADDLTEDEIKAYLIFARAVNEALDECGFPLCKGNVMASNPYYAMRQKEWLKRCADWINGGTPQDLLNASIFFDFRGLFGEQTLLEPIKQYVKKAAQDTPRFISFLATNAMNWHVPLTMFGGIDTTKVDGVEIIDIKANGTALVVDFARIYALALGIEVRGTEERLLAIAKAKNYDEQKGKDWVAAFNYLQMLRLKAQLLQPAGQSYLRANQLPFDSLSPVDRIVLKATFNVCQAMQQRLKLDYVR
jgi:CBS domain-containing protein